MRGCRWRDCQGGTQRVQIKNMCTNLRSRRLKTEWGLWCGWKEAEGDSFGVVMSASGTTHLLLTGCLHCETQTHSPFCKVKCETQKLIWHQGVWGFCWACFLDWAVPLPVKLVSSPKYKLWFKKKKEKRPVMAGGSWCVSLWAGFVMVAHCSPISKSTLYKWADILSLTGQYLKEPPRTHIQAYTYYGTCHNL